MQPAELLKYIENPALLTKQSVKQLQKLVDDFPYFQSAHILLSVASKKWDTSVYQQSLKKTAIVATNRTHLFNLIHQAEHEEAMPSALEANTSEVVAAVENVNETQTLELEILKATELADEKISAEKIDKPLPDPNEILEKEIQNRVVNSFVEKEILKTPELHHPKSGRDTPPEPESFVEWLNLLKKNNGQPSRDLRQVDARQVKNKSPKTAAADEKPDAKIRKEKNRALIDKIIESSPGIIRAKEEQKFFSAENKAKESLLENEHLVTETLARIYALQGSVNKAVRAYEILSLKFPQKSAYFATLIQKLKSNQ